MTADLNTSTALYLRLLENGYQPLPLVMKKCLLKDWPRIAINADVARKWGRSRKWTGIGIRLGGGLCVIDIDINDETAVAAIVARLRILLAGCMILLRHGNGAKIAIFVRTSEPFGRIASHRYTAPGQTEEDGAHGIEIFGGGSPRQFGVVGPCGPGASYRFEQGSPFDTPPGVLPVFTKSQLCEAVDAAEVELRRLGWQQIMRSQSGENPSRPVHDLTADMVFHCDDDVPRTLAELKELARLRRLPDGLRCSASWLEGPSAKRPDRCIVGATSKGTLTVWETASAVTHMPRTDINDIIEEKLASMPATVLSAIGILQNARRRRQAARAGKRI